MCREDRGRGEKTRVRVWRFRQAVALVPRRTYDSRRGRTRPASQQTDWRWLLDELARRPHANNDRQENR